MMKTQKLLALVLVFLCLVQACLSDCPSALANFYHSTDGPNWNRNDGWLTGAVCDWFGIGCISNRVRQISLHGRGLDGFLPLESLLLNCSDLDSINLSFNSLTGTIPSQLSHHSTLTELSITYNQLSGTIPSQLSNQSTLMNLFIDHNQLSGSIPSELSRLSALKNLGMAGNSLTGSIPSELGNLHNLGMLDVRWNMLTGEVPVELALSGVNLYARDNSFTGQLPLEFCNVVFDFNGSSFDCPLPNCCKDSWRIDACGTCTSPCKEALEELYESTNGQNWNQNVGWLSGDHCDWSGIGCDVFGDVTSIQQIYGNLVGELVPSIQNCSKLKHITMFGNHLTGTIPSEVGELSFLESLNLGEQNSLSGSIPSELGKLSELEFLTIDRNQLTGSIPSELGQLTKLTSLTLDRNQLTGSIPSEFSQLGQLRRLWLFYNELTGEIPSELLSQIDPGAQLLLYGNSFSGELSEEICNHDFVFNVGSTFYCPLPSCCGDYNCGNPCIEPPPPLLSVSTTNTTTNYFIDRQRDGCEERVIVTTISEITTITVSRKPLPPPSPSPAPSPWF